MSSYFIRDEREDKVQTQEENEYLEKVDNNQKTKKEEQEVRTRSRHSPGTQKSLKKRRDISFQLLVVSLEKRVSLRMTLYETATEERKDGLRHVTRWKDENERDEEEPSHSMSRVLSCVFDRS